MLQVKIKCCVDVVEVNYFFSALLRIEMMHGEEGDLNVAEENDDGRRQFIGHAKVMSRPERNEENI